MKNKILALGCMAALLAFGSDAYAATGTASATIGTAITISQDTGALTTGNTTGGELAFGHIIPNGGGTLTISPAPATAPVASGVISTSQMPKGPAYFIVTGDSGRTYNVTLPSSTATITKSGGGATMTVSSLNHDASGTLTGGSDVFHVGGVLTVAAGQAVGVYTGSFIVNAAYN